MPAHFSRSWRGPFDSLAERSQGCCWRSVKSRLPGSQPILVQPGASSRGDRKWKRQTSGKNLKNKQTNKQTNTGYPNAVLALSHLFVKILLFTCVPVVFMRRFERHLNQSGDGLPCRFQMLSCPWRVVNNLGFQFFTRRQDNIETGKLSPL